MLPDVKTPLFSPRGIPYMFRFAIREDQRPEETIGADRKMFRWIVYGTDKPKSYLGIKARYSQALFNPATICCICLIIICSFTKVLVNSLLDGARAYLYLTCTSNSMLASQYGNFYEYSEGVMQILNASFAQSTQQYGYSVNSSLWNIQTSVHQYTSLLGVYYQALDSSLPDAAYLASENVTSTIGDWAENQLSEAANYSNDLLMKIHSAMGSLGGNSSLPNATNIATTVPRGINENLTSLALRSPDLFFNLTSNAKLQLDTMFANASGTFSSFLKLYTSGLPSNISLVPSKYETAGCTNVLAHFHELKAQVTRHYKVQISIYSFVAGMMIIASLFYTFFKWRQEVSCCKRLEHIDTNKPSDAKELLSSHYDSLLQEFVHKITSNRMLFSNNAGNKIRWFCNYAFSTAMTYLLIVGWCSIILGIATGNFKQVIQSPLLVDLNSDLPSSVSVNHTTNSTTMLISTDILNDQISKYENVINANITGSLTELVTQVISIISTLNTTMRKTVNETLASASLNLPSIGFNFSLIYEDGFAIQEIELMRLPSTLNSTYNSTSTNPVFAQEAVYSILNVTDTLSSGQKTFRAFGVTCITAWASTLILAGAYIFFAGSLA